MVKMRNIILLLLILSLMLPVKVVAQSESTNEINTIMMRSTFKIEGTGSCGSCFIVGKPSKEKHISYLILVTAAHVLENISGETAVIYLRKKRNDNIFEKFPFPIKIRNRNNPLWTKNKNGKDIAVMNVNLPIENNNADLRIVSTDLFADDKYYSDFEIHPGDEMYCLGFPMGAEANQAGFPVLRSGRIASFPLTPMVTYPTFLLDFKVYKGNSGGPVYFADTNRIVNGKISTVRFIAGLVSQEYNVTEKIQSQYEKTEKTYPLSLAVIIHASYIKDTINQLQDLK